MNIPKIVLGEKKKERKERRKSGGFLSESVEGERLTVHVTLYLTLPPINVFLFASAKHFYHYKITSLHPFLSLADSTLPSPLPFTPSPSSTLNYLCSSASRPPLR